MRKWIFGGTAAALLAISSGVALASWGGGTGSDAVEVVGTVRLDDTKYYIDGVLEAKCASNIVCNVTEDDEGEGDWLLDFGGGNYYISNPGDCAAEVATLPTSDNPTPSGHTIQGKLARHGEIDVYVVDGCDLRSGEEGGSPPWSDSDNDGVHDLADLVACGGDPLDASKAPERLGNGIDDDADTLIDETQAPVAGVDCDGDGFDDDEEDLYRYPAADGAAESGADCDNNADDDGDGKRNDGCNPGAGTSHQARCAGTSPTTFDEADDHDPADFDDNGIINILDVSSFAIPAPAVWAGGDPVLPGDPSYNARWDISDPGLAINILDIIAINRPKPYLGGLTPGDVGFLLACLPD